MPEPATAKRAKGHVAAVDQQKAVASFLLQTEKSSHGLHFLMVFLCFEEAGHVLEGRLREKIVLECSGEPPDTLVFLNGIRSGDLQ
jgi:hypothetical protein